MKINTNALIWMLLVSLFTSCNDSKKYDPLSYLDDIQQQGMLRKIIPYCAKLPEPYSIADRFNPELDSFYREEIKKYKLQHYFISEDSVHYFMINRPAPSLYEKRLAIAGRFKKDGQIITDYEESFWTFKMKDQELREKGKVLFAQYVEGKDISGYMPGKKEEEWIEFPDVHCSYDKETQCWKFSMEEALLKRNNIGK